MAELSKDVRKKIKFSETAVDGLFTGLLAGLVMAAFLAVTALLRSETLSDLFGRFYPAQAVTPLSGFLLHLAVSSVYGILYGLFWYLVSIPRQSTLSPWQAAALGIGYGVVLFFLAWYILLPASASPLRQLPLWQFGAAHLLYGISLSFLFNRRNQGLEP